jgi:RimJ/RimL family protein N-acetyltransferase
MILGERIRLRRDERSDIANFAAWLNDPEVRRYLSTNMPVSVANEEQWFENMLKLPTAEQPYVIEIRKSAPDQKNETWQSIGNCGFMNLDQTAHSAEVGLFIGDKSHWNKGYGTEVMRLLLRFGFETLNLNRIFLRVDEGNQGGIRAYEKAGFVHEARLRQAIYRDGEYQNMLMMSVIRSEWNPGEQAKE